MSFATAGCLTACDYVGIVSGNKEPDKFAKAGFHALKSEFVNAPLIEELPVALECELLSYDHESCYMTARIVNVSASDEVLGDDGRIDPSKAGFVAFDPVNSAYLALGSKVGTAFSDGKALKWACRLVSADLQFAALPPSAGSTSGSKNHRTALYCRQADSAAAAFGVSA